MTPQTQPVAVASAIEDHALLDSLGLGLRERDESRDAFLIGVTEGVLDLRPPGEHERRGVRGMFPPDRGGDARSPLIRAFGKRITAIEDLTAGFGGDAYRLARAGYRVRAFERHPAVYAVLVSAWENALSCGAVPAEIRDRLSFLWGEGLDAISAIEALDHGVYIDPMYPPPRRASAKPRRELQVLRGLLGGQEDAAELVERARERAARVVVKRPHHAEPLVSGASFEVESKLVRFDVYMNPERMEPVAT